MFNGFSERTFEFLWNLRLNNEKVWFDEHKAEFERELKLPMKELKDEVFELVRAECGEKGFTNKLSRIYRDARRLRGNGPYRTNMWFSIERPSEMWTATPVFWFEIDIESWSYGLGYYQAKPETMAKLRARIDREPKKFEDLVEFLSHQTEFTLDGPEYVKKKQAPSEKTAPWYNKKSFSLAHRQNNGTELFSPDLKGRLANGFVSLMPIYDYIITLDQDPSPKKC